MKISMMALVELIKWNCPFVTDVRIEGTWEDYGAGMWWDTIIVYGKTSFGSYQALCPRDHKILTTTGMTAEQAQDFIVEMKLRGW